MSLDRISISFVIALACGACGPGNENAGNGALAGTVVGAGTGAIIGSQAGSAGNGAVIGGAAGAIVGGSIGATRDEAEKKTSEEDEFIERQKKEIEKQQREIEDIRRQKYHDDYYRFRYGEGDQMAEPPASDQTLGEN